MRDCCPDCDSKIFVKNGITRHGAQNHLCKDCGRQFTLNPQSNKIPEETRNLVNKLLLERLSLQGICRVTGVSESWLLAYISGLYEATPRDLGVDVPSDVEGVVLTRVEADELWSFVGRKAHRQWVWLALDITTRQVIAMHIGKRGTKDARKLWDQIPDAYKGESNFFTDLNDAYREAFPEICLYQVKKKWSDQPRRKVKLHSETACESSC